MIDSEQKLMPDLKFNRVTIEDDGGAGLSFYKDDSLWCPLTPTEETQLFAMAG